MNETKTDAGALGSNAGLGPLVDSEEDPARLWAEIHRLRAAVQGPQGYETWQDAATAERVRRVRAEAALRELVALKDQKDRLRQLHEMGHGTDYDDYHRRQPLAWAAAREVLKRA